MHNSFSFGTDFILFWTGYILFGLGRGRCGWFMHEWGHGSLTGNMTLDRRLQEFYYAFGCGMSAGYWRNQHNKHHAAPQKLEHDIDLNTLPLLAFNSRVLTDTKMGRYVSKSRIYRNLWLPIQHILFPFLICFLVLLLWCFYLHPRFILRKKLYLEGFWLLWFYWSFFGPWWSVWWLFPQHSFLLMVIMYLGTGQVSGPYIFINFAVSHTHLDVLDKDSHVTWVEYASKYTMNISNHWFVNWWMGYLNFQIEHHLFPQCPQYKFPMVAPRVKELFEKHGENYLCMSYMWGMRRTLRNLKSISKELEDVRKGTDSRGLVKPLLA